MYHHLRSDLIKNQLRERIHVPHDNYLKSIYSSRACGEGYFCLLFP